MAGNQSGQQSHSCKEEASHGWADVGVRSRLHVSSCLSRARVGTRDASHDRRRRRPSLFCLSPLLPAPSARLAACPLRTPTRTAHLATPRPTPAALLASRPLCSRSCSCSMFVCLFRVKIVRIDRRRCAARATREHTHTPPQHMSKMVLGHPCDLKSSSLICRTRACAPQNARVWG